MSRTVGRRPGSTAWTVSVPVVADPWVNVNGSAPSVSVSQMPSRLPSSPTPSTDTIRPPPAMRWADRARLTASVILRRSALDIGAVSIVALR